MAIDGIGSSGFIPSSFPTDVGGVGDVASPPPVDSPGVAADVGDAPVDLGFSRDSFEAPGVALDPTRVLACQGQQVQSLAPSPVEASTKPSALSAFAGRDDFEPSSVGSSQGTPSSTTVARSADAASQTSAPRRGETDDTSNLARGARGEDVRRMQEQLRRAGFDPGPLDGKFGPLTERAVRSFQQAQRLEGDGVAGPLTKAALGAPRPVGGSARAEPASGEGAPASAPGSARPDAANQPQAASGQPRPVGSTSGAGAAGTSRPIRGFVDVDVNRLREALPPQARHLAPAFIESARRHNLDPRVLVAISKFETGNWTSSAFRNKSNAMGVSNARGPIAFGRAEESIDRMARTLSNPRGPYRNATSIGQVGSIYAPVGASNDPNGTNGHWPRSVSRFADEFARQLR
jgi:peptidoglycan hydrolase-like protein with peptidoglycan-binding domain